MPGLEFVYRHLAKRHSLRACCKDQRTGVVIAAGMAAAAVVVDGGAGRYPVGVGVVDRDLAADMAVAHAADKVLAAGNDLVVVDVAGRGLPLPYILAMDHRSFPDAVFLSCSLSSCRLGPSSGHL